MGLIAYYAKLAQNYRCCEKVRRKLGVRLLTQYRPGDPFRQYFHFKKGLSRKFPMSRASMRR